MRSRLAPRLSYANVAATLALIIALTSPAWASPAANSAASLGKKVKQALGAAKSAKKTAAKADKKANQALASPGAQGAPGGLGPQGPQGAQGLTGQTGPQGPSEQWFFAHTTLPANGFALIFAPTGITTTPLGTSGDEVKFAGVAPSAFKATKISAKLQTAPGTGNSWTFQFLKNGQNFVGAPECTIVDTATTCSPPGSPTPLSVSAGDTFALIAREAGTAAATEAMVGWAASP